MIRKNEKKTIILKLNNLCIDLEETEFLIYASFVIRCKKEIEWQVFKGNQHQIYIFSRDVSLVFIKMDKAITVVYRYNEYNMTRQEFNNYIEYLYDLLDNYKHVEGLDYRALDPVYLEYMLAVDLPFLVESRLEIKKLTELKVFVKEGCCVGIKESRHLKMIQSGLIPDVVTSTNLINQSYTERVRLLCNEFTFDDYGKKDKYIIVYNDNDIIRDGAHRAAILYAHNMEESVTVQRLFFSKNYYTFERYFRDNRCKLQFRSLLNSTHNTRWVKIRDRNSYVLRSDSLVSINSEEIKILKNYEVKTCINLTTNNDESVVRMLRENFDYHNVAISYLNSAIDTNCSEYYTSVEYYMYIVSQSDLIKELFQVLLCSESGVVIYCAIGRDRTGVVCILLQMLMGCCLAEMVEDYSLTDAIYEDKEIGLNKGFTREKARKYIITFLHRFYMEYNSVEEYLYRLGFTQIDVEIIRQRLIRR